ncbi:energy-coupling factor transport system substrate-specific component [Peptoniphilus koenoeneniae]|uniref:Energy-coupling factor transport system substrate-specific component n=1 Tax=Peptoniphilus koenoeneniae TaxID=507751 RepID=A0ABU0AUI5_9FIRM|nr:MULTISPECIES: MptD family putative ECF transporter S component [Peptoniphilus]ERT61548.1 TIGR02185 family protein [Peptoniphilus sp. BV3C26]MDQ0274948.1 energy-coupling factor transport system substrate-specific component [Peptoniphilus koenoeneniae]
MKTQKKSSKNAVTAGVLIALYFVTYLVIGVISMPVPVLFLLMPMLVALLAAPTYHMLLAKTKSATAIVIAAILPSILLVATGHIPIAPLVAAPAGIIAMFIAKGGNYIDFKKNTISHMFFSLNLFGGFLPIWLMREAFFESLIKGKLDQSFCNTVRAWTPIWMLPVMIIGTFIFSLIGSYFTKKILNKKLESAGVL